MDSDDEVIIATRDDYGSPKSTRMGREKAREKEKEAGRIKGEVERTRHKGGKKGEVKHEARNMASPKVSKHKGGKEEKRDVKASQRDAHTRTRTETSDEDVRETKKRSVMGLLGEISRGSLTGSFRGMGKGSHRRKESIASVVQSSDSEHESSMVNLSEDRRTSKNDTSSEDTDSLQSAHSSSEGREVSGSASESNSARGINESSSSQEESAQSESEIASASDNSSDSENNSGNESESEGGMSASMVSMDTSDSSSPFHPQERASPRASPPLRRPKVRFFISPSMLALTPDLDASTSAHHHCTSL